jgi:hypothetical protein
MRTHTRLNVCALVPHAYSAAPKALRHRAIFQAFLIRNVWQRTCEEQIRTNELTFDGEVVMSIKLRKLEEQVIVITGASSGIGLVTARMVSTPG